MNKWIKRNHRPSYRRILASDTFKCFKCAAAFSARHSFALTQYTVLVLCAQHFFRRFSSLLLLITKVKCHFRCWFWNSFSISCLCGLFIALPSCYIFETSISFRSHLHFFHPFSLSPQNIFLLLILAFCPVYSLWQEKKNLPKICSHFDTPSS